VAKETDLSPVAEMLVGSNPTARIYCFENLKDVQKSNPYLISYIKSATQEQSQATPAELPVVQPSYEEFPRIYLLRSAN